MLEFALDLGHLGLDRVDLGPREVPTRPGEVVDEQERHRCHHERPRDVA